MWSLVARAASSLGGMHVRPRWMGTSTRAHQVVASRRAALALCCAGADGKMTRAEKANTEASRRIQEKKCAAVDWECGEAANI